MSWPAVGRGESGVSLVEPSVKDPSPVAWSPQYCPGAAGSCSVSARRGCAGRSPSWWGWLVGCGTWSASHVWWVVGTLLGPEASGAGPAGVSPWGSVV
jgi:hypothetical protein